MPAWQVVLLQGQFCALWAMPWHGCSVWTLAQDTLHCMRRAWPHLLPPSPYPLQPATAPKAPAGLGSGLSHAVPPKPRPVTARVSQLGYRAVHAWPSHATGWSLMPLPLFCPYHSAPSLC